MKNEIKIKLYNLIYNSSKIDEKFYKKLFY